MRSSLNPHQKSFSLRFREKFTFTPSRDERVNSTSNLWKIWKLFNLTVSVEWEEFFSMERVKTRKKCECEWNSWIKKCFLQSSSGFCWYSIRPTYSSIELPHGEGSRNFIIREKRILRMFRVMWRRREKKGGKMMNNKSQFPIFLLLLYFLHMPQKSCLVVFLSRIRILLHISSTRWCSF